MSGGEQRRRAPNGLGKHGRAIWRRIAAECSVEAWEYPTLHEAAKTADAIAELEEALEGEPALVPGSQGQPRAHPLIGELRLQRDLLTRMLGRLSWPPADDEAGD
jgi:hypothetical protein